MESGGWKWWHGAALLAVIGVAQTGIAKLLPESNDAREYEQSRLPVFAPPQIAFPIAWSINALCLSAGLVRVLNLPPSRAGRGEFIRSQAGAWVVFTAFNAAYFGLRSPINAAILTLLYTGLTAQSARAAFKTSDARAIASLATTLLWLCLAAPLSITQALWNADPFWHAGPFMEPPPGMLRRERGSS